MKDIIINIRAVAEIPGMQILAEMEIAGDKEELVAMIVGVMYQNKDFSTAVLCAAIFFCDHQHIDIAELAKRYGKDFKQLDKKQ
jgi:hypothetical protein